MELRFHIEEHDVINKISLGIQDFYFKLHQKKDNPIIVICIGTDRSTGDSLGPLVGTFLNEMKGKEFRVLGNLSSPVHATNLNEHMKEVLKINPLPFIVAVDAGLGKKQNVGKVLIKKGPLYPGSGVDKKLPPVGNMHLTGLVNVGGYMEYFVLQSTRLSLVFKMARIISSSIYKATNNYLQEIKSLSYSKPV